MDAASELEVAPPAPSEAERRIRAGVSWIGALAVIWAIGAPIQFAMNQLTADETMAAVEPAADSEAAEPDALPLRFAAPVRVGTLAINLLFVGAWGFMWLRAQRNVRAALKRSLGLLVLIGVGNAISQPKTLLSGLMVTLLTFILLGRALKATRERPATPSREAPPPVVS
ncbi:MAG TPA: hypothetical protein VLA79_00555 [Polyangia bacterium]|nr:hypothetical protein [Polyangia bacterium]